MTLSRRMPDVCGFLPPHMLRSIAENSDDAMQREYAHGALELSAQLRGARGVAGKSIAEAEGLLAPVAMRRNVFDAQHRTGLPGKLVRAEGAKASGDVAAGEAYDGAGRTYDFAAARYGANSESRRAVVEAWKEVGIDLTAVITTGPKLVIAADANFQPLSAAAELPSLDAFRAPRRRREAK